jgi:hemolysin activation/secretion protein
LCYKTFFNSLGALCLTLFLFAAPAYSQAPVESLPGVVEPLQEPQLLPAPESEDILSIPVPEQRSPSADSTTSIEVRSFVLTFDREQAISIEVQKQLDVALNEYLAGNNYSLDLAALDGAAQLSTNILRSSGYLLARSIIPPQEVERQSVRIDTYVGLLGKVEAQGNTLYKTKKITSAFSKYRDEIIQRRQIESGLLRVRDLPGVQATAIFSPGDNVGESDFTINVIEEDRIDTSVRIDNHGVDSTGKLRTLAGVDINNVTGNRDLLQFDALHTFDSGDLINGRVSYEITERSLVHTLGASYSVTDYDVEEKRALSSGFYVEGSNEVGSVFLRSAWVRQRDINFYSQLGLSTKRSEVELSEVSAGVDRLTVANIGLALDGVDTDSKAVYRATFNYSRGIPDFIGSMDEQGNQNSLGSAELPQQLSGEFYKFSLSNNRLQSLSNNHSLTFRLAGQYSDDWLSSIEKMGIGGPNSVRAYPVSEHIGEKGLYTGLGWLINAAALSDSEIYGDYELGDLLTFTVFADYGVVKNKQSDSSYVTSELSGYGLQSNFRWPNYDAYIEFILSRPFNGRDAQNGDDFQFWFSVGASF